jgi:hypothetical protein
MKPFLSTFLLLAVLALLLPATPAVAQARTGASAFPSGSATLLISPKDAPGWMPDFQGGRISLPEDRRVDVVILGDGYTKANKDRFVSDAHRWYRTFTGIKPWSFMPGLFRVRAIFTPSAARATPERQSYYQFPATADAVGDVSSKTTRARVFLALDALKTNPRRDSTGMRTHTYVVMLVRNSAFAKPSGKTRALTDPKDSKHQVRVAFSAFEPHEFGHAYGRLKDEYIDRPGRTSASGTPKRVSVYGLSNIAHTRDPQRVAWAHLAPGSVLQPDKAGLAGRFWIGGMYEGNAYHFEPVCLMNGTHENWNRDRTKRGANLRHYERFCLWCEEILVARSFAKAGLLDAPDGTADDGFAMYDRWVREWRPKYQQFSRVAERIRERNATYTRNKWQDSRLFESPLPLDTAPLTDAPEQPDDPDEGETEGGKESAPPPN